MTVKADSKGRLTGAQPETRYLKRADPDGTITYVPEVPKKFDQMRDVTEGEFEEFFGINPNLAVAENLKVHHFVLGEGFLPNGLVITHFLTDEDGKRVFDPQGGAVKVNSLIRIKKDSE